MDSLLTIGRTALAAAQAGMSTTSHNIANASTPGYNRQVVVQAANPGNDYGVGFIGQGVSVTSVARVYDRFLANQVGTATSTRGALDGYYGHLSQLDNLFADPQAGLSPAIQEFFGGLNDLASNPASQSARAAVLSSAEALAGRFRAFGDRLDEVRAGVNAEIASSVDQINVYARRIADLNQQIAVMQANSGNSVGRQPNDLMDQRDQLVLELRGQLRVTVTDQPGTGYNLFVGNGQPLVVGSRAYELVTTASPSDPSRLTVAYSSNGNVLPIAEGSLTGGSLGGLLEFRSKSLDTIHNPLGLVAIGLAGTINAQHRLGQDLAGDPGGDLFTVGAPLVAADAGNTGGAVLSASIVDYKALTASDYLVRYDGVQYQVVRASDGAVVTFNTFPRTVDGIRFDLTSPPPAAAGDEYRVRPTAAGASSFAVAIADPADIAAGAPVRTAAGTGNAGTGSIGAGAVDVSYLAAPLVGPVTLTYDATAGTLSGFPAGSPVTVTVNGTTTTYAAGAPVTYAAGATIAFDGVSFAISGQPADGDTFTVGPNGNGVGDNRNAVLMAALQSSNTLLGGTTTFQGAYGQMVAQVGTKTRELEVTRAAADRFLQEAVRTQQSESGVNLDEEAANLMRYQQAYQASARVMQVASQMFDVLLGLGS